ncbi:MAG: hypothetical protein ACRYFU_17045 [Janthinobacterium lividum]
MRSLLHLVAFSLLTTAALTSAQITNPNDLVSGPPKPPRTRERAKAANTGNLQWLWQYAQPVPNGNAVALRGDDRFEALLEDNFKQPQALWGKRIPLSTIIPRFIARYGEINSKSNRYLMVDGCVPSFCAAHGMLWMDLGAPEPLMVFAAVDWTTEDHTVDQLNADYNLWLFPSRQLSADALPLMLTESISDWDARLASAHRAVPHVVHAILVEPNGDPFPLNPALAGANTLPPQPDTVTPKTPESE